MCPLFRSRVSGEKVQLGADGSISVGDSVLIKVSCIDDDNEKDVLLSWSLQVTFVTFFTKYSKRKVDAMRRKVGDKSKTRL